MKPLELYCCIYDLFRFNPRFGNRPVQAPTFQQTDAHPCGRSQWLRPLLLSWCWRPGLQHWLPSGNSSRRKSEPGRKSSEEQQMLAMSAAKTEPHRSVPWWVLHWVTVSLCQLCLTIWSLSPLRDYKRIQLCSWMELVHVQPGGIAQCSTNVLDIFVSLWNHIHIILATDSECKTSTSAPRKYPTDLQHSATTHWKTLQMRW